MPKQSTNDHDSASCRHYINSSQIGAWLHSGRYSGDEGEAGPSTTVRSESTSVSVQIDEDYGWGQEAVVALGEAKDSFMEPSLRSGPSKPCSVRVTAGNDQSAIIVDDHVDELESSIASLTPAQAKRDMCLGFVQRIEEEIEEFETPDDRAAFLQRFRKSEYPWDDEQWSQVYAMYLSRNPADIPQDSEQRLAVRTRMEQSVQFFGTEGRLYKHFKQPKEMCFDIRTRQRQNFGDWSWEIASAKGTSPCNIQTSCVKE